MSRKLCLIFIILPALFFMAGSGTGCWDKREPDELGIIIGLGFDINPETGLFKVLAEVANPVGASVGQEGGGGGGKAPHWVVEAEGETAFAAIKRLELLSTRVLFWSHLETVIFSEEFARNGLRPVLDFIERGTETRLTPQPFVVQGDVKKLLEIEYPLEQLGSAALRKQFTGILLTESVVPEVDSFRLLFQFLSCPGQELILPRVQVLEAGEGKGEGTSPNSNINPVRISGAAVFRGDRLAGFLEDRETSGYQWITNNIRGAALNLKCPGDEENLLSVSITETSTRLEPQIEGDDLRFKLFIDAAGRIEDYTCVELPLEEEFLRSLGRRMAETIRSDVEMSLYKARELKADVFGMGNIIYRTKPKEWARLEERWEELFSQIKVDIEIEALIERPGFIIDPYKIH